MDDGILIFFVDFFWGFFHVILNGMMIIGFRDLFGFRGDFMGTMSGWWFGTFFIFPYIGNNHPN